MNSDAEDRETLKLGSPVSPYSFDLYDSDSSDESEDETNRPVVSAGAVRLIDSMNKIYLYTILYIRYRICVLNDLCTLISDLCRALQRRVRMS